MDHIETVSTAPVIMGKVMITATHIPMRGDIILMAEATSAILLEIAVIKVGIADGKPSG